MTVETKVGHLAAAHDLPPSAAGQLIRLVEALASDREAPTAIRNPEEIVDRHLADSLTALEVSALHGARRIADIGSGAGFPGLPLAIALPATAVDLVEASRRKSGAVERLRGAAGAGNARAVTARAEDWGAGEGRCGYQVVTARAVADLAVLAEYAAPLLEVGGALVAWKGRRDRDEERAAVSAAVKLGLEHADAVPVVPFAGARDRHLHVLVKREPTPSGFPRRPGRAAKRPLA